MAIEKLKLNY